MKFISLFAGVGGFDLALTKLGHECVYANDIDKYCKIVYDKHFETKQTTQDIRTVKSEELPEFDLLVGGFPCQSFSVAGKRGGFEDTRGTLFFEIARLLRDKQPRLLFLENVKGLLSHDGGRTFKTIISTLTELGYDLQWQVLNSKNFGVPQNRERVFIVGHLRGTTRPEIFPITGQSNQNTTESKSTKTAIARTLTAGGHSGGNHSGMTIIGTLRTHKDGQGFREMKSGLVTTIPARAREDGSGQPVVHMYPHGTNPGGTKPLPNLRAHSGAIHNEVIIKRFPLKFLGRNQKNIDGDYSYTVDTTHTGGLNIGNEIRRLTPKECERLQGFPDDWTLGVSDSQRYKMMGNAVSVPVVYEIASRFNI